MRLDGYIRISATRGREGDSFISPDVQREAIVKWAELRGVEITDNWPTDKDQTGGKLSRPHFDEALARIRSGKTGGIAVARLDRFSRAGVADALKLIESIIEAGGEVASVEEGIDPTTPSGEFSMTVFLALARMQRRQVADGWKEARHRAVERGVHIASRSPTGYQRTVKGTKRNGRPEYGPLALNADAPHVAEVFRRKAAGASWRDLAHYFRQHGVESPYRTTNWQPRALSHLIENRAYLGEARSGEFSKAGAHPAIVDEATFLAAQEAVGRRPVNSLGGALLSGLLRCSGCSYTLKADTMQGREGEKMRLYRCRTERSSGRCPAPASTLGRVIEPFIVDKFFSGLGGMRAEGCALTAELEAAEKAVERADRELATYLSAVSAEVVGADEFRAGAKQRREAADTAHDALDRVRERAGLADLPLATDLESEWPNLAMPERRRLLHAGLDAVVLHRGRGVPIAERVEVFWHGEQAKPATDRRRRQKAAA